MLSMVAGGVAIGLRRSVVARIAPIAVTATRMCTDPLRRRTQGLPFRRDHAVGIPAPHGPANGLSPSSHVWVLAGGHGRRFRNRATFIFPDSQLRCLLHDLVFGVPTADQTDHAAGSSEHIERCPGGG